MEPLISIIVPVYNVERYLDKCVESIVGQTYQNIEIIMVDDGAKDSSGDICDEWARKDARITVIHKENAGLGFARNTGLEHTTGEYVVFVDSDDFISSNYIEKLVVAIQKYDADTVYCSHYRYYSKEKIVPVIPKYEDICFKGNDVINKVLLEMVATAPSEPEDRYIHMSVWHGIYSLTLIREFNIRFPSERELISEDIIFHIDYLQHSLCVGFISNPLYYYRENNQSLSAIYNPQRFDKEIILYNNMNHHLSAIMDEDDFIQRTQRMFLGRVRSCVMRSVAGNRKKAIGDIIIICNEHNVQQVLKEYPFNLNPIQQRVFNFFLKNKNTMCLWILAKLVAKKNLRG